MAGDKIICHCKQVSYIDIIFSKTKLALYNISSYFVILALFEYRL